MTLTKVKFAIVMTTGTTGAQLRTVRLSNLQLDFGLFAALPAVDVYQVIISANKRKLLRIEERLQLVLR
jgi:hypothetical protein